MTHNKILVPALTVVLVLLGAAAFRVSLEAQQASTPAALTGTVRSAKEGLMEGVLVSAKRNGSPITTTVVTNAQGVYAFPQARLTPGQYDVTIRAVGYVLDAPAPRTSVSVAAGNAAQVNLNLRESNPLELALQLTDPEWLASFPLTDEQKFELRDCSRCHTAATRRHVDLQQGSARMGHEADGLFRRQFPDDVPVAGGPNRNVGTRRMGRADSGALSVRRKTVAAINLSDGMWKYELKKLRGRKAKRRKLSTRHMTCR